MSAAIDTDAAEDVLDPGEKKRLHERGALRFAFVVTMVLSFSSVVVTASGSWQYAESHWHAYLGFSLFMLISSTACHVYIFQFLPTRKRFKSDIQVVDADYERFRDEKSEFSSSLSEAQLPMFVDSLINPKATRSRIIEEIRPIRRVLHQSVSTTVKSTAVKDDDKDDEDEGNRGKGDEDVDVIYPLMTPPKGSLQDHLVLRINGDDTAATLTYHEYLVLMASMLRALLAAPKLKVSPADRDRLDAITSTAFGHIARRGRIESAQAKDLAQCVSDIERIATRLKDDQPGQADDEVELLRLTVGLITKMAGNYAIVVVLPHDVFQGGRAIVTYQRYIIPHLVRAPVRQLARYLRDRARMLLGTRPISLEIQLNNAALARSYHLNVFAPDGMHLGEQELINGNGRFSSRNEARKPSDPYKRFRKRLGQGYLHLYLRSIPADLADNLRVRMRFHETPPGSMAPTMMAALASFALIYIAGVVISAANKTFDSDFPALVLAFPALAAAFVGFDKGAGQLLGGTLASRASSLTTIIISLLASGLYMAQTADEMTRKSTFELMLIDSTWWQLLASLALLNFTVSSFVWVTRTYSYYWLASRDTGENTGWDGHR